MTARPPRRCARCLLLETHDIVVFDQEGICNVCRNIEHKRVDWQAREQEFLALLDQYRGKSAHDCIVPFSGGKDSTFTLYALVRTYGLRPLVVCAFGLGSPSTLRKPLPGPFLTSFPRPLSRCSWPTFGRAAFPEGLGGREQSCTPKSNGCRPARAVRHPASALCLPRRPCPITGGGLLVQE